MAPDLILGIVGMPASGKTTVTRYMKQKYKVHVVHFADFIWQFLKKRNIPRSETTAEMAGLFLWHQYSDFPIIKWGLEEIKKAKANIIVLDSLRTVEEAHAFAHRFKSKFHIIAATTSPAIRKDREKRRARLGKVTDAEFNMRDRAELTTGVGDLIALADHYVNGNVSKQAVKIQTDAVVRQIKKSLRK